MRLVHQYLGWDLDGDGAYLEVLQYREDSFDASLNVLSVESLYHTHYSQMDVQVLAQDVYTASIYWSLTIYFHRRVAILETLCSLID